MTFNIINRIKSHPWQLLFFLWVLIFFTPIFHFLYYGEILYINGEDEYSYLNYEFAKETLSIKRLSNILIIYLHEIGLNGSEINFIFDSMFFICAATLIGLIVNKIVRKSNFEKVIAVSIFFIGPLFLTQSNPLYRIFSRLISSSDLLTYYFVYNHSVFPPYLRTPEGQFSIILLLTIIYLIVSNRNGFFSVLLLPAMYFFTGIYSLFIGILYFLISYALKNKKNKFVYILFFSVVTYFIISLIIGLLAYITLQSNHLLESRIPLLSLNFLFILLGYFYLRKFYNWESLNANCRALIYSILIASFAIYNTNLINGILLQPQHYEIDGGLFFGLMVIIFYLFASTKGNLKIHIRFITSLITLITCFFVYSVTKINIKNYQKLMKLEKIMKNNDYLKGFKPSQIYISDIHLSSIYTGLHMNKSFFYLSGIEPAFLSKKNYYINLMNLRKLISNDHSIESTEWFKSIDYLLNFYNSDSLNWDRFTVLRRGYYFSSDISLELPSDYHDTYALVDLVNNQVILVGYKKH